jgi:hypothetical protein
MGRATNEKEKTEKPKEIQAGETFAATAWHHTTVPM